MCSCLTNGSATAASLGGCLSQFLQTFKALWPQLLQELLDSLKPLRPYGIQTPGAVPLLGEQTGFAQHAQVLRYGLHGYVEVSGDLSHRARPISSQPQDLYPVRLREGPDCRLRVQGWRPMKAIN